MTLVMNWKPEGDSEWRNLKTPKEEKQNLEEDDERTKFMENVGTWV